MGRILASVGNYFYSTSQDGLWVHLYGQNRAAMQINEQTVTVRQATQYPWEEHVRIEVGVAQAQPFTLHLRIPGWCEQWTVKLNGVTVQPTITPANGYTAITRTWHSGDSVELDLAMAVQSVWAHPAVRQMQGRLAIQRGPIVYCLEGVDNRGINNLERLTLTPEQVAQFRAEYRPDLLGGVTVLRGVGVLIDEAGWNSQTLYRHKPPTSTTQADLLVIPYCVWDNRAPGEMRVWFRAGS